MDLDVGSDADRRKLRDARKQEQARAGDTPVVAVIGSNASRFHNSQNSVGASHLAYIRTRLTTRARLAFGTGQYSRCPVRCGIAFPATHIIMSASPTTNGPSLASPQDRLSHSTRAIRVSLTSLHTVHVPRRRSGDRIEQKRSCSLPPSARRCRTARAKCSSIAHTPIPDSLLDWLLYHRHDAGLYVLSVYL
jgi:hypothetical protein